MSRSRAARVGVAIAWIAGALGLGAPGARGDPPAPGPARVPAATPARVRVPRHLGVLDRDGVPFSGAEVVEAPVDRDGVAVLSADAKVLGTTDGDGALAPVPAPSRDDVRVVVRASGATAVLVPDTAEPVLVRLVPASPVRGWVRDVDGKAPQGAVVEARRVGGGEVAFVVPVEESGRFAFESTPEASWRLFVRRRDGAKQSLGVTVGASEVSPAVLAKGALVSATVRDLDAPKSPPGTAPAAGAPSVKASAGCEGLTIRLARLGGSGQVEPIEGVCAADGTVQFADLAPGVYEAALIDAQKMWDGPAPRVEVEGPRAVAAGPWWVRRRGAVAGVVVDGDRAPLEGAAVRASPPPGTVAPPGGFGGAAEVRTGADGRFRIEGLAPSDGWRLVVSLAGKSPAVEAPVSVAYARTSDVGRVRLDPTWRLRVLVRDAEGHLVAGADAVATPAERPGLADSDPVSRALVRAAKTDDAGAATLADLPDGPTRVRVSRRGFVDGEAEVPGPAGRREAAIDVTLAIASRIRGRLVAGPASPPLTDVVVRGRIRATGEDRVAEPDAEGRFSIDELAPGPVDVEAVRRGGSPDLVLARVEGAIPGTREELMLPLAGGFVVSGRVTGPSLAPDRPARVRLEVLRLDADRSREVRVVAGETLTTADRGERRFSFAGVPPGPYSLRAIVDRVDGGAVPVTVEAADVPGVELPLPAGGTISGRVRDARTGKFGLGALVALVRLEGGGFAPGPAAERPTTTAAADGAFEFEGVAPGLWRVEASDVGAATAGASVRLAEGDRATVPTLTLTRGGWVEGRLVNARGRPLAGVPVRAWRRPRLEEALSVTSAEDGTFRLTPLEAGRYRLRIEDRAGAVGGVDADVEVVDGEATKVDLSPTGRALVTGTLRRHGQPVGGGDVEAASADACGCDRVVRRQTTDAFGRFAFDGLPAGTYVLRALDGRVLSNEPIRLKGGERVDRDLELGEARIEGIVRTAGGAPVYGAEVVAAPRSADDDPAGRVRTGPDGTFVIRGLAVAAYRVEVTPRGRPTRVVDGVFAEISGGGRPLEVVLGRGGSLDVLVRDEGRRAVAGAEVWVENPAGEALHPRALFTSPSGHALVDGLPDGPVRVRVRARGLGRPRPVAAVVREGTVVPVEVTTPLGGALRLVVSSGRDPVARARVDVLRMPEGEPVETRRTLRRGDDRVFDGPVTARTGTLLVEDLADGDYTAVVAGGGDLEVARVPVRVRRGEVTEVRVTLVPRAR